MSALTDLCTAFHDLKSHLPDPGVGLREKPFPQRGSIMIRPHSTRLQALLLSTLAMGFLGVSTAAVAQDTPPPASAPGSDSSAPPKHRHHDPAWAACKKQADDQNIAPGDARHEFMKSCVKAAQASPPPAS
jgi:hypothetical protein